jgi:hypothetical protein
MRYEKKRMEAMKKKNALALSLLAVIGTASTAYAAAPHAAMAALADCCDRLSSVCCLLGCC